MFDYQQVKLIALSDPVGVPELQTCDELIAYCARVSNPANQLNTLSASKLVKYLVEHMHWSPFEMVSATLEIKTTRDIGRQILRHRSFSFQEFCVDENTLITTLTKSGNSKKIKIKDLYKRQQNKQYSKASNWLVKVYDHDTGTLIPAKVKEVFKTGIKPVFKLTLDNSKQLVCTDQHKLLTFEGYKRLNEITSSSFIACNGIPMHQDKQWLSKAKQLSLKTKSGINGIADLAGVKPVTISKWLRKHGLQYTKKEIASYTPAWNKGLRKDYQPMYGKHHSLETREKQRESSKKGENSNLYKTGNYSHSTKSWRRQVADFCAGYKTELLLKCDYRCPISGIQLTKDNCDVDHILPVCFRPDLAFEKSNLRVIHKSEHQKKTNEEIVRSKQTITYSKVVSIEYLGERETYDMEIDHTDHNYVANGIVTHNSQRYAAVNDNHVNRELRFQDKSNRQNSIDFEQSGNDPLVDDLLWNEWIDRQNQVAAAANSAYQWALENGIAKEQARAVLPEGMTMSTMYMAGTLRSWIHYCQLRCANGTQKEHRDIALKCWDILSKQFPSLQIIDITQ